MKLQPISEIFNIYYGNKFDLNKMIESDNGVSFVNRSRKNNGITAYVKAINNAKPNNAGSLTIALGGSVLSTFLQFKPFYTGQNVAIATPIQPMTEAVLLFYAACIKENQFRYSTCGREANRTFRSILIPSLSDVPKWVHHADTQQFDHATEPSVLLKKSQKLKTQQWENYQYGELFNLKKGARLTKANMTTGTLPYIGAIDSNNGISNYIGQTAIHDGNTITVSYNGSVAEAFYQPEAFWATDDVNVLYPKFEITPSIALFLCTLIRLEKYRYNYGRKWHLERMRESKIRLPAKEDGTPDWDFMSNYIQSLPFSSQI